jgi:hypothetical protein
MRACALYHQHGLSRYFSLDTSLIGATDFGEAERQFQNILAIDPYRIDNIDIYSDILYVTDNRIKLSKLAHDYLELDKDRPEICCLVGECYIVFKPWYPHISTMSLFQEIIIRCAQNMKRRSSTSEERSNLTEHICLLGR